jgi:diaminopimelate decarboxylase
VIGKAKREKRGIYSVVGATCMEKDYLLNDIEDVVPERGDYIKIDSVGAYTLVLSPPFINPAPAIVAAKDNAFKLIRSRQTPDEMFKNYIF